jgi:sugar (pentulose or hexulose) kinase
MSTRSLGICAYLAIMLAGCAATATTTVVDTYCLTAKKRTWDPDVDSVQTMREAVVYNRAIDRRCGILGKV